MKEWLLLNTNIKEEEYDRLINIDKDYSLDNTSNEYILKHEDSLTFYNIMNFTLDKNYKKWNVNRCGNFYIHNNIPFLMLSDVFYDDTLLSTNRFGKCHTASYFLAVNTSLDLLTLICTDFQNGKDFLHSVLYNELSNEIIDYTLNLIIDKDIYFKYMNARLIRYIDNYYIKKINENIIDLSSNIQDNITIKEILCFPDEINNLILKFKKVDKIEK